MGVGTCLVFLAPLLCCIIRYQCKTSTTFALAVVIVEGFLIISVILWQNFNNDWLKWKDWREIPKWEGWIWVGGWWWKVGSNLLFLMAYPMETWLWASQSQNFSHFYHSKSFLGFTDDYFCISQLKCRMGQRSNLSQWHCRSMSALRMEAASMLQSIGTPLLHGKRFGFDSDYILTKISSISWSSFVTWFVYLLIQLYRFKMLSSIPRLAYLV